MDLFRKSALQRMLSPEQLDQLIQITKPRDWIALLGLCAILITLIIWSIWGTVSIDLPSSGIFIKPGGYRIIESAAEGQITKIGEFKLGDIIKEGQVIAELGQPLLQLQIDSTKDEIKNLELEQKKATGNNAESIQVKMLETKSKLKLLENQFLTSSKIRSPYTGSFLAMRSSIGVYIKPGDSILSMEDTTGKISAIVFLPPTTTNIDAIKPGMKAKIFPGLEKNPESGYLLGKVNHVSKFPASPQVITNILNNDYLVKFFSQEGPPYLVYIDLISDPKALSGYQWSSTVAEKTVNITSGSLCSVLIEIANQPPIAFLIPNIKKGKE